MVECCTRAMTYMFKLEQIDWTYNHAIPISSNRYVEIPWNFNGNFHGISINIIWNFHEIPMHENWKFHRISMCHKTSETIDCI